MSMQVHAVTSANAYLYRSELEQFFRERHRIYAEELHWVAPSPDGLERDQFDTDAAVYLIGTEDGRVVTGSRFVPTDQPHMLSEVFPHLVRPGRLLREPAIAEWTRGFVVKDRREGLGIRLKAQFCAAVMEWCLGEGIEQIGGIQEIYWLSLWKRFGWNVTILGEPSDFNGVPWVPAYFDVSETALVGARRWGKLETSILVERGPHKPFVVPSLPQPMRAYSNQLNAGPRR